MEPRKTRTTVLFLTRMIRAPSVVRKDVSDADGVNAHAFTALRRIGFLHALSPFFNVRVLYATVKGTCRNF